MPWSEPDSSDKNPLQSGSQHASRAVAPGTGHGRMDVERPERAGDLDGGEIGGLLGPDAGAPAEGVGGRTGLDFGERLAQPQCVGTWLAIAEDECLS